jgi:hypothetical protein
MPRASPATIGNPEDTQQVRHKENIKKLILIGLRTGGDIREQELDIGW